MAENRKNAGYNDGDDKVKKPYKPARKKVCPFCTDKAEHIDYKDGAKMYVNPTIQRRIKQKNERITSFLPIFQDSHLQK